METFQSIDPMRYGIIDLGTNTFKLLVADVVKGGVIHPVITDEIGVKLGEESIGKRVISEKAMNRGVDALHELISLTEKFKVNYLEVVATSGIRSSGNGQDFIRSVKRRFDKKIRIISGEEEAEMIYRGARQAGALSGKLSLILDIGGGSNEFIVADNQRYHFKESYDLGIARLLDRFKPSDPIKSSEIEAVNNYLEKELSGFLKKVKPFSVNTLVGCAGTFETYRSILNYGSPNKRDEGNSSFLIDMENFNKLYKLLVFSRYDEREKIPGLQLFRVEMIVLATIFVNFILEKICIEHIVQSDYAVKEGVLDKMINP